jgi:4-diphosphocytidyl-2-C-methyl-D-erythritol kinase
VGDRVEASPAFDLTLEIEGPFAAGLPLGDNLVLRAARLLRERRGVGLGARLELHKALPPASGVGGGSSDAAAALRVLARLWDVAPLTPEEALALGADVPVCLAARPARMGGVGERLEVVPALPPMALVLANPRRPVETPAVFAALAGRTGGAMGPVPPGLTYDGLVAWLAARRNDLADPAASVEPAIARVLDRLGSVPGVDLARLSGSGATAFGLCRDVDAARRAAAALAAVEPGWWIAPGAVLG